MVLGSNWIIIRFCPPCPIYMAHSAESGYVCIESQVQVREKYEDLISRD